MAYISFQPNDYFNTKLWTGNSTNSTAITGVGFQPDMVWIKNRSTTDNHAIFDAIRGATYRIYPNATDAQVQATNSLHSFDSDGFTLNDGGDANGNGENIVGWNWKANGAGSSNTDGSITSTVSASTTSGFSIVQYTGTGISSGTATVGHGLGAVPSVVIQKRTGGTANWGMYHKSIGNTASIALNSTDASNAQADFWGNTTPTSSVVTIGANFDISGGNILYCFVEKQGFSKFGSYVGNENADGTFIYTGFKPAFVMIKNATQAGDRWIIHDNKRDVDNGCNHRLFPDGNIAESTSTTSLDFLSNGFKQRTDAGTSNTNGQTYIYMAFAEEPLVSSNGVPATAR